MACPLSDEVIRVCASLMQYASEHDIRQALLAEASVAEFLGPPSLTLEEAANREGMVFAVSRPQPNVEGGDRLLQVDHRVIMISEVLSPPQPSLEHAEPGKVHVSATSRSEEILQLLTNRSLPKASNMEATEKHLSASSLVLSSLKTPLSILFITRKQKLSLDGMVIPHTYGEPLYLKDLCIQSIDVTRPLEVLEQMLEKMYLPMFNTKQFQDDIRAPMTDLLLGIRSLDYILPNVRTRNFVEKELLMLCDSNPRLEVPQLMEHLGAQAYNELYLRKVRETRDKCKSILDVERRLQEQMEVDTSEFKGQRLGETIESVLAEKIFIWERIGRWVDSVHQQLTRREWLLVHALLRSQVETNFEREFGRHQSLVKRVLRYLGNIPDVVVEIHHVSDFYQAAESILSAVCKGTDRIEKLSLSLLNEVVVELMGCWIRYALRPEMLLATGNSNDTRKDASGDQMFSFLRTLKESLDVLRWLQSKYVDYRTVLRSRGDVGTSAESPTWEEYPRGVAFDSASVSPVFHPQLETLYQRCMAVQNFIELHVLRLSHMELTFLSGKKQGSVVENSDLVSEVGAGFIAELKDMYTTFLKDVCREAPIGSILWSTSDKACELFDEAVKKHQARLDILDENLAMHVGKVLSDQYAHVSFDGAEGLHATQLLWTFTQFQSIPLKRLRQTLNGFAKPVEEQLERLALRIRDDFVDQELARRREHYARCTYRVSAAAVGVVHARYFEQATRHCYETRDFVTEKGWHRLLSLRNHDHYWGLNETLNDFLGFSLSKIDSYPSSRLAASPEVYGTAYALIYLEEVHADEDGWKADPFIHLALELVEKHKDIADHLKKQLYMRGRMRLFDTDLSKSRDIHTMHTATLNNVTEKAQAWLTGAMEKVRSLDVQPGSIEAVISGPIFTVVDVTQRDGALVLQQRGLQIALANPTGGKVGTDAERGNGKTDRKFQLEVRFPHFFDSLAADVRYLESVNLPLTLSSEFAALCQFIRANEKRSRLAKCLSELLVVYYADINGEDTTIALLAAAVYREVNEYLMVGFGLAWEEEDRVEEYVRQLSSKLVQLTSTVQEVRSQSEVVYGKIQKLHLNMYHPEAISQTVNELLTITNALSLGNTLAHQWVNRVQPLLNAALLDQLRYLFHGWTADFASMRDNVRFLQDVNAETEVFHLRPLRVHMMVIFKEVRLESPAAAWRKHWLLRLDEYFRWVNHIPRLYSKMMDCDVREHHMALNVEMDTERGYAFLLDQLPPSVLEAPFKAINKCIEEAVQAEQEWRNSQQFLNIDVGVMQQRFGNDLKRWGTAVQCMSQVTAQLMDVTQPNKLLGGIIICAEGVQNELSRKFDRVSQFALSKFANVLEQESMQTFNQLKEEGRKLNELRVNENDEEAIEFLCELPQYQANLGEKQESIGLLVESEDTLRKLGKVFPDNWMGAGRVKEEFDSLKSIIEKKRVEMKDRRGDLTALAKSMAESLQTETDRLKSELENLVHQPSTVPSVVQHMVAELSTACGGLQKLSEKANRLQAALGLGPISTTAVDNIVSEVSMLQELWSRVSELHSRLQSVGATPFFEVQPLWLQQQLQDMESELLRFPISLKSFRVYQELEERVASASGLRRFMYELRSEAMAPLERAQRHWIALKQRLGVSWVLDCLTVEDIWASRPADHAAIYNDVLEVAQGERRIELQLSHISSFWESFQFSLTIYQKRTCLVRGWDALFDRLADDLGTCSGMRASPFFNSPPLISAVNEVEVRLNQLRQVLETLVEVQKHWVYLDGIFNGNQEIRLQLPHDTAQFDRTTRELLSILPRPRAGGVLPEVNVSFFLQDEKLAPTLDRMASQIRAVQVALAAYLDGQRRRFPRFFFVGDDDLLEIMGNSCDPVFLTRHLRKMFAALACFEVESESSRLLGFGSVEGERVLFTREPIEVKDRALYDWLSDAEGGMVSTLRVKTCEAARELFDANTVTLDWMRRYPTQVLCLALQLWWVKIQEKQFLGASPKSSKKALRPVIASSLSKGAAAARSAVTSAMDELLGSFASQVLDTSLGTALRHCLEQLITVVVYQRDTSRLIAAADVQSVNEFEWCRIFRPYIQKEDGVDQVVCCMADAKLTHGFEYTGQYERLVQTPLTDKCYFTLTQALHTRMGGSPVGPAGTGKTETVKALGMQLGRHVLVFNCDDTFDFQAVSRIFLGLCQVGSWGCFDEFNRLEERIMSALSLQIQLIQESLRQRQTEVNLQNTQPIPLNPNVAIFITMNPGYAGRSNLPSNLKQLFRTVTMTVPDRETIAEVMLFAQGFQSAEYLSRKIVPFFRLCDSQFSKQAHYDFGLRALKSVLVAAGKRKRDSSSSQKDSKKGEGAGVEETSFVLSCIVDNIAPKLVREDVSLFYPLLRDFFPEESLPANPYQNINDAIIDVCRETGLTATPAWTERICQLHSTKLSRHGIMLVGPSGTGKTTAWKVLMAATVRTNPNVEVRAYVLEPKVLAKTELFGTLDITTREWKDGVFSAILRRIIEQEHGSQEKEAQHWIIFDGDVDPEWVENLNSVLDDNKILTLPNGERLALPSSVRIMFEVESLQHATPATVSRCGMLWFSSGIVPLSCVLTHSYKQLERQCVVDARGRRKVFLMESERLDIPEDAKKKVRGVTFHRGKAFQELVASSTSISSASDPSEEEGRKSMQSVMSDENGEGQEKQGEDGRPAMSWRKEGSHPDAHRIQSTMVNVWVAAFGSTGLLAKGLGLLSSPSYRPHCVMDLNELQLLQGVLGILWEGIWKTFCTEQALSSSHSTAVLTKIAEKVLTYAVVWGFGAPLAYEHRERLAAELRLDVTGATTPCSIMEVDVDYTTGGWRMTRELVTEVTVLADQVGASSTVIPTVDTARHEDIITAWIGAGRSAILCGPPGSGKTMSINAVLNRSHEHVAAFLNFSSGTTGDLVLKALEQHCTVKNTARGFVMSPTSDKKLLLFCDEINLPALDTYGTQTVLQLLRQLIERGGFFRARDNAWINVEGVQIVGACNPPTDAGRIPLPNRFGRWAPVLFVDFPSQDSLDIIYTTYCKAILHDNLSIMRSYATTLSKAMVHVYLASQERFTTLQQPHYLYSPRELSRWSRAIYEGILTWDEGTRKTYTVDALVRLAVNEGLRVFADRLVTEEERSFTDEMIDDKFREQFTSVSSATFERPMLFSTLLSPHYGDDKREDLRSLIENRLQVFCEEEVEVPLVVFDSMIDHLVRVDRVLRQPLGHMLMAGSSGVGKSVIARLAAWLRGYSTFWLQVHREYDLTAFEEDLRALLRRAGCKGEKICFIFDESNILQPAFLEYMNALLASGEVPGLFEGEEWVKLMQDIRESIAATKAPGGQGKDNTVLLHNATDHDLYQWFVQNVQEKLHVVFTINPSSAEFASRAVASPALFNRCTIDWFGDWEYETLLQIARARISGKKLLTDTSSTTFASEEGALEAVISVCCAIHQCTSELNTTLRARHANTGTFITPRHFIDFVTYFVKLFEEKCSDSLEQQQHLRNGLKKLDETSRDIEEQRRKLQKSELEIAESNKSAQLMLDRIVVETDTTQKEKTAAEQLRCQLQEEEANIIRDKEAIENDLSKVEPALREAEAALNTVKPEYLREIRAYATPPPMVQRVLEAVLTLMGEKNSDDWDTLKGHIRRDDFLAGVKAFKPSNVSDGAHVRVNELMRENLTVEAAYRASKAAGPLLQWVFAQVGYVEIFKKLRPLRQEVEKLTQQHSAKLEALSDTEKDIEAKEAFLQKLKVEYQETTEKIADLKYHTSIIASKCERATTILSQLLDEQSRWEEEVSTYDTYSRTKIGDCIVSASFLAYIGFFDENVRQNVLIPGWRQCLDAAGVPLRSHLDVLSYLAPPSLHLEWEQEGLPKDKLCLENAVIIHRAERFPLLIDPTGTAATFLQNRYARQKISKASFTRPGYLKQLEMAVRFGYPIIMEDAEFLDPAVTPLLNQEYRHSGGRRTTRVGPHEVELSSAFKLFLITRDPNFQPSPTLAGQSNIINFTVTRSSLFSQCLYRVVLHERPDIDSKRSDLIKSQGEYQLRLRVLEQRLLTTIAETQGSLLEDDQLISTMASLKEEACRMKDDIRNSDISMKIIEQVERRYRPLAHLISSAFFALKPFSLLSRFYRYNVGFIFRVIEDALKMLAPKIHNMGRMSQMLESSTNALASNADTPESVAEELDRIAQLTSYIFNLIHHRVVRGMFREDHLVLALRLAQTRSSVLPMVLQTENGSTEESANIDLQKVYSAPITEEEWEWLVESLRGNPRALFSPKAMQEPQSGALAAPPKALVELSLLPSSKQRQSALAGVLAHPDFSSLRTSLDDPSQLSVWRTFFQSSSPIATHAHLPADLFPTEMPAVKRVFLLTMLLFFTRQDDFVAACLKCLHLFFDGTEEQEVVETDVVGTKFFSIAAHSVAEAVPELSSSTPLLMVSDANYDPSNSVEQLARASGVVLYTSAMGSLESTTAAQHHVEEGIKNGCWVLLKNVHLAKAYMDTLEKYLHAERLEGRFHANFRLFLTAERGATTQQRSFLPSNLLEDCVVVVFEAPPGVKSSMLTTWGLMEKKRPGQGIGDVGNSGATQKLYLAAAWLHAVITERLFYTPLGWTKRYEFSDAEYERVIQAVDAWSSICSSSGKSTAPESAVDWVALRSIISETIYGGKISNPFDQLVLELFTEKVLNPSLWKKDYALISTGKSTEESAAQSLPDTSTRSALMQWVTQLPDGSSPPQWLGLPDCVARVLLSKQAVQALERLGAVQTRLHDESVEMLSSRGSPRTSEGPPGRASSPGRSLHSSMPSRWTEKVDAHCFAWLPLFGTLSDRFRKHAILLAPSANGSSTVFASPNEECEPLRLVVKREAEIASGLLARLLGDMQELADVLQGSRKLGALLRSLADDLIKDTVPQRWRIFEPPHTASANFSLTLWMGDIQSRLEHILQLCDAVVGKTLFRGAAVQLGLLFSPGGFLTAFKQQHARDSNTSLENLIPYVKLSSGDAKAATSGKSEDSLVFSNITLYAASVTKEGKAALIESGAASMAALTTSVNAVWQWSCRNQSSNPSGGKKSDGKSSTNAAPQQEAIAERLRHQDSALHTIAVPLYASASRDALLEVVDIDVVDSYAAKTELWYERGVCLATWVPTD